ncbi:MAG: ATP-dependent helicase [Ruminococcus sp.]|nr:ATP-dependent helicase [Ruminococcus sp.]
MNYKDFKSKYNIRLNQQQESAVVRVNGQTLLLAVPGSGKTTVIVARLGYMLMCCNIRPENILTMTYNVSAARDMKKRFCDKFEDAVKLPEFRTINGFCATVIMHYERVKHTNAFSLVEENQITKIIRAIYLDMTHEFPSESTIKDIKTKLVYSRNMMLKTDEIKKMKIGEVDFYDFFTRYKNYKQQNKIMDYDDQLEYALKILIKNPDILSYYQERYKFISIDEAQDTSKIQHMIIRLLAGKYKNIFMVGDEDQSIYGFRAAYPKALLEFNTVYPDASVLLMEKNYRSTYDIVSKANDFIKLNKCRHDKNMHTDNQLNIPIKNIIIKDYKYQYNYIIKMLTDTTEETAILYRNNDSAIPIIDLLDKNNIGYRLKENDGIFFTINTIADIMNILSFAFYEYEATRFFDFYYKLGLRIKKDTVSAAVQFHRNSQNSFFDTLIRYPDIELWQAKKINELRKKFSHLKKLNSYQAILYIINKMEYGDFMKERGLDESKIHTLLSIASQNEVLPIFIERMNTLKSIVNNGSSDENSLITLSTIHSSKGLEYKNVIMIDVRDGIFPSVPIDEENEKDMPQNILDTLEEERRLFYVGVTRAKEKFEIFSYESEFGKACDTALFTRQLLKLDKPKKEKTDKKTDNTPLSTVKSKNILKEALISRKKQIADSKTINIKKYQKGDTIIHKTYGKAIIEEYIPPVCKIRLENGEQHSIDIEFCLKNNIIKSEN